MIYIEDQNKQNIHPNIMINNKRVQFSDKLKRYPDTIISSENSWQMAKSQQDKSSNYQNKINPENKFYSPETSSFDTAQLRELSKQIPLKNISIFKSISKLNTKIKSTSRQANNKEWKKVIMQPSTAENKLLQKIQQMLQKQSFKPVYATANRDNKLRYNNTMATQTIPKTQNTNLLNSEKSITLNSRMIKQFESRSRKAISPDQNRTSTLSQLINLSKFSTLSNKTLQKYLMCIQKEMMGNQLQKSRKISQFNLLDTERSSEINPKQKLNLKQKRKQNKQVQILKQNALHNKNDEQNDFETIKKEINQIHRMVSIFSQQTQAISVNKMLEDIKYFIKDVLKKRKQNKFFQNEIKMNEQSTCLLQD